jgi:hypothetical protein
MLSRGGNRPGHRGRAPADLTAYAAIRGTVETGLTPVRLDAEGEIASDTRQGAQVELGAYGAHNWRRTSIGLDYRGDYRRATPKGGGFDGTNQALSLDLTQTLNRRTTAFIRQMGGTSTRAFGGFAAPAIVDPTSFGLVNNELFDTRTYFAQTSGGVIYQASARTSYTFNVDGFFVKRPDPRLVGVSGYRGTAGLNHRVTARTTIGAQFQYMKFQYPRVYGGTDAYGGVVTLKKEFTRKLTVDLTAGLLRVLTTGTERITLSPEIAAILGRSTGVAAFERLSWIPQTTANVTYLLERSRFTGGYMTGIDPGNGVYLTNQMQSAYAGYSFTGIRKLSLGLSARTMRNQSRSIDIGPMTSYGAGGGANYTLTRLMSLSTQVDYRTFGTSGVQAREGFFVSIGLSFSPTALPVSIW